MIKQYFYRVSRSKARNDFFGKAEVFSILDANSGYRQVEVKETDRDKPTFTDHLGLFRLVQVPFGLNNVPKTF